MKDMGIQGIIRSKPHRTTVPDKTAPCPLDKVNREFRVPAPNMLWVSDFTYVATWKGFVYVAFVIDAYARRIVGWLVSTSAHAGFVLDALEQAVHKRHPTKGMGLVHHSDRGSQYLSIRYTERLAEAGIEPSVGSVGDSYENALAETINGLFKAEVIPRRGPWRSFEAVEYATLEWVDWFNNRCILEPIGNVPPAEAEATFYAAPETEPMAAKPTKISLRQNRRGSWKSQCMASRWPASLNRNPSDGTALSTCLMLKTPPLLRYDTPFATVRRALSNPLRNSTDFGAIRRFPSARLVSNHSEHFLGSSEFRGTFLEFRGLADQFGSRERPPWTLRLGWYCGSRTGYEFRPL